MSHLKSLGIIIIIIIVIGGFYARDIIVLSRRLQCLDAFNKVYVYCLDALNGWITLTSQMFKCIYNKNGTALTGMN